MTEASRASRGLFYAGLSGFCGACAGATGKFLSSSVFVTNSPVLSAVAIGLLVLFNTAMWTFQVDSQRYQSVVRAQSQTSVANSFCLGMLSVALFQEYQVLTVRWFLGIV